MEQFILAIDQGTTGTTCLAVDRMGNEIGRSYQPVTQYYPQTGWVEQKPEEIWESVVKGVQACLADAKIASHQIKAIGITNQRETVVAWDAETSKPIYNAVVWQCRRSEKACERLRKNKSLVKRISKLTGLKIDPYFSATKVGWIMENVASAKQLAKSKRLKIGTIDSFLVWQMTAGQKHLTDVSNASRTLLMDIKSLKWDEKLLQTFKVPRGCLPQIVSSSGIVAGTKSFPGLPDGVPISGIAGDQQAALFGQLAIYPGDVKCTFGTGSFILLNTGEKLVYSKKGLLSTVAWRIGEKTTYALEGGAYICGAAIQWLRDDLQLFESTSQIEALASEVSESGGVVFVPTLQGLGAPFWVGNAKGALFGLSRSTTRQHIAYAVLHGLAAQNTDIILQMVSDMKKAKRVTVKVDGGASKNNLLMQMQADLLGARIVRPKNIETTALGAAYLAGLGSGFWKSAKELQKTVSAEREFKPKVQIKERKSLLKGWRRALQQVVYPLSLPE